MNYSFSTCLSKEMILFSPNSRSLDFINIASDTASISCSSSYSSWSTSKRVGLRLQQQLHGKLKKSHGVEKIRVGILSVLQNMDSSSTEEKKSSIGRNFEKPFWKNNMLGSSKLQSVVLLNLITVVYASDILVIKEAESIMDPAAFSAVRFAISAIPFLPFVFRARGDVQTRNAGIELGFWLSLAYFIEAIGLLTSEASRASLISMFTVISVPLLDGMLGAVIPTRIWLGVLMSALGVAALECGGSPPNIGDFLNLLSAIFFGIHMVRTEQISRSTEKENFLALFGYEMVVVAVLSTLWLVVGGCFDCQQEGLRRLLTFEWTQLSDWIVAFPWIPAIYTGLFSTGVCSFIEFAAMRDVSATETAIIYGLEPIWGAGFAWFLLGERWGTLGWIGATFVLGGSLLVQMFGSSSPTNQSAEAKGFPQKCDDLLEVPQGQLIKNTLSASPVVVRSSKNIVDILK